MCPGAATACPVQGDTAFWVWTKTRDNATGVIGDWDRVDNPPYRCLGPTDPLVPLPVAIQAIVERDFKTLVVLKGGTKVEPAPETLVNVLTEFSTDAPSSYDIPTTILGQRVVITATAKRWTWHVGDVPAGTSEPRWSTTFTQPASLRPFVEIEWGGTYTIGSDPTARPVTGTATTTGPTVPLEVREARSQYESG